MSIFTIRKDIIPFLPALMWVGLLNAQPDLSRWSSMVSAFEQATWVVDLEKLEPGCVLESRQPELITDGLRGFSLWAEMLTAELESLPLAEHHADRALERLLEDGMRRFQLVEASADRLRPTMELALEEAGLPLEWAVLPMVLTGWDGSYYGPGRRAGPWAMDLPTGLSLGLAIRRGWDERHVPESMARAACQHIVQVQSQFPDSPLRQVLAFVRGHAAGSTFDADAVDSDLLGWLHLLRVMIQVDRNFRRDRLHALWALRERQWTPFICDTEGALYFSHHHTTEWNLRALRNENPWFTTDSIGTTPLRPSIRVHSAWLDDESGQAWCQAKRPETRQQTWSYTVRPGDVLGTIARRCGVRIEALRRWNGLDGDLIRAGQTLDIRGGITPPPVSAKRGVKTPSDTGDSSWTWYTVQPGESYWSIAESHPGVSLADLLDINDVRPDKLQPDMRIRIPNR